MVQITTDKIRLAFDMHGCPNRCRHCWLGAAGKERLSEQDVRWGVERFREYLGGSQELTVSTWIREPDYWNNYRALYALEAALSDDPPERYELLSIFRLAHDAGYAEWRNLLGRTPVRSPSSAWKRPPTGSIAAVALFVMRCRLPSACWRLA